MTTFRTWGPRATLAALLFARCAAAAWPEDGAPVCDEPGDQSIRDVVSDGSSIFVAWQEADLGRTPNFRVQRIGVDGVRAWPAAGVGIGNVVWDSQFRIAPDGAGGCYAAWLQSFPPTVHVQHIVADGTIHASWPAGGLPAYQGPFFPNIAWSILEGLDLHPESGGGCILQAAFSYVYSHDGHEFLGSGVSVRRIAANGILGPEAGIESCQTHPPPSLVAIPDGVNGLFALRSSPCRVVPTFHHLQTFTEPGVPLNAYIGLPACQIAATSGGSVVLGLQGSGPTGPVPPRLVHWNPDTSPAGGSPADGVPLDTGVQWNLAVAPSGSTIVQWRPSVAPTTILGKRFEPDLALSPGWAQAGVPIASPPSVVSNFTTTSDANGGALVAWEDARALPAGADIYATRVLADGSVVPVGGAGFPLCRAVGDQRRPLVLPIGAGKAMAVWQDGRSLVHWDIYAQLLDFDSPVPATVSTVSVEATPGRVSIEWRLTDVTGEVVIERADPSQEWREVARLVPGSRGRVRYDDLDVRAGQSLGYRIGYPTGRGLAHSTPIWVEVPSGELAVRLVSSHSPDGLEAEVTLPTEAHARLELVDLAGRRMSTLELSGRPPGKHLVRMPLGRGQAGIAWLRLQQGDITRIARISIFR